MPKTPGLNSHPIYKLGKAKAQRDRRNLMFGDVVVPAEIEVPETWDYDVDKCITGIPTPMFGNDVRGCCVISGRGHQTLRFENWEQKGAILKITDKIIFNEYFRETGGPDEGLVVLESLKLWRKVGWRIKGKRYRIAAFAEIDRSNHNQVKQAIIANIGIGVGVGLPLTAQDQFQSGRPWDYVGGSGSASWSWGGHYVHIPGYTEIGPICVTWARKQQMTWEFWDRYCDEAYAIMDALNRFRKPKSGIDVGVVEDFIAQATPIAA
jgi:hypothetical protein